MYLLWVWISFCQLFGVAVILFAAATSSGHIAFKILFSPHSQLSFWRQFLVMFCAFGSEAACLLEGKRERECVHHTKVCIPVICRMLPEYVHICSWLYGKLLGWTDTVYDANGRRQGGGGELLKYKLQFFCTMRQPLKNLCRLQTSLYQVKYTIIVALICYLLGRLSESTRSVFIVADDLYRS